MATSQATGLSLVRSKADGFGLLETVRAGSLNFAISKVGVLRLLRCEVRRLHKGPLEVGNFLRGRLDRLSMTASRIVWSIGVIVS